MSKPQAADQDTRQATQNQPLNPPPNPAAPTAELPSPIDHLHIPRTVRRWTDNTNPNWAPAIVDPFSI